MHIAAGERRRPVYTVKFKAPHKLTVPKLVAGLHEIEPARDVISKDGDTFEFPIYSIVLLSYLSSTKASRTKHTK